MTDNTGVVRVREWAKLYENHRTRELKRMEWIPIPNKMDGDGYTELVDDPNGAAHLGVWLCILQIASKCDPRGTLTRGGGVAHTPRSIARISRLPAQLCEDAIKRLLGIGWLEAEESNPQGHNEIQDGAAIPRISGDDPAQSRVAARRSDYGMEGNGTEGNGTEGKELKGTESRAEPGAALPTDQFFEERYALHPKKRDRVLAEQSLCQIAGIETAAVQEKFRTGHDAWIVTDDFQWKGGAKCPTFAMFITDRTWEYPPHMTAANAAALPSPYVPYKPPKLAGDDYESQDDLLARARIKGNVRSSGTGGMYVRYRPPV